MSKTECHKVPYQSKQHAKWALNREQRIGCRTKSKSFYFCKKCGAYHLTKMKKGQYRRSLKGGLD